MKGIPPCSPSRPGTDTILAAVTGLLVAAAPASAQKPHRPKSICAMPDVCILYNGHAGLGAN